MVAATMAVAGAGTTAAATMAEGGAMVMEATTAIPVLGSTSAHLCILTTATLIIIRHLSSQYRQHHLFTSSNHHRRHNKIHPVTGTTAPTQKVIILISRNAQTVGNKLSRYRPHLPHLVKEPRYVAFFHSVFGHGNTGSNWLRKLTQRTQCHGAAWYWSVFRTVS